MNPEALPSTWYSIRSQYEDPRKHSVMYTLFIEYGWSDDDNDLYPHSTTSSEDLPAKSLDTLIWTFAIVLYIGKL
jgi:hypothetical protein